MAHGISQLENRDWNFKRDVKVTGTFNRSPDRYYLEEFFEKRPALNAVFAPALTGNDAADAAEIVALNIANSNFEILGTNGVTASVTFSATRAGIVLTTAGADNDQVIILPHLDTNQTAWQVVEWGTENQVVWECAISTGTEVTAGVLLWAGLKLTNTPTIATDNDQVYFRFSTDDSDTTWRAISSISGTDTNTDTGVTVAAATIYKFKIAIASDRTAQFFINDVSVYKTTALANDIDLIPYVGIQCLDATPSAQAVTLHYEKISRILFE